MQKINTHINNRVVAKGPALTLLVVGKVCIGGRPLAEVVHLLIILRAGQGTAIL